MAWMSTRRIPAHMLFVVRMLEGKPLESDDFAKAHRY